MASAAVKYRLALFLDRRGMSPSELARRLGVTGPAVIHWLTGKNEPTMANLRLIAKAFRVTVPQFLNGEGAEASSKAAG